MGPNLRLAGPSELEIMPMEKSSQKLRHGKNSSMAAVVTSQKSGQFLGHLN
jgi:hypothetical protein